MNLTFLIVLTIIVLSAIHGTKKGITKEITNLISWGVTLFVMSLIIMLYTSLYSSETRNSIYSIAILMAVIFVYGFVRIFFKSAKIISKLPVFNLLDKCLGFFVGIAEGFFLVWLFYILNEGGLFGTFGEIINMDTAKSEILSSIYNYNYLIKIAKGFPL